ncbi:RagB/SusD family nutrient uptake outer membrane protein, partial [Bacteroides sp. AF32-15BH]
SNAPDLPGKEYKRERRIELLHENDRYWSLLRWGKADGLEIVKELNTHQNACMEIAEDGKSFEIIDLPSNISDNNHAFTSRRYLFPVPQSERDVNSSLDQNPEW